MDEKKIGKFLKELREERGLSQYQLEEQLNISRSLLSKLEKGNASLTLTNAKYLCNFYDIAIEELLAGERKNKNNYTIVDNALYTVLGENGKLRVNLKRFIIGFVVVLLFLFASFFINFYCSVKVYTIHTSSESIWINNGLFFRTKDRVYFYLDFDCSFEDDSIDMINLYYEMDGKRRDISSQSFKDAIFFVDFNGYEEYVDFSKLDDIIDNIYIEISLDDGSLESTKLEFNKDYVNNNIFVKKEEAISVESEEEDIIQKRSKLYDKVQEVYEKYKDNDYYTVVNYEGVEYTIFALDQMLQMYFYEGKQEYKYEYIGYSSEFFFLSEMDKEEAARQIYSFNYGTKKCMEGACDTYESDIEKFMDVIDLALK